MSEEKIRVLVAKPGLDGHDRGAKVVARALRDAGFEVIYTGIRQTPQMIAEAALQEDVDVVGLSILSGAHLTLCPKVVELLRAQGQEHVLVLVGGIVPDEDVDKLKAAGINGVFGPGTSTQDIADFIRQTCRPTGGELNEQGAFAAVGGPYSFDRGCACRATAWQLHAPSAASRTKAMMPMPSWEHCTLTPVGRISLESLGRRVPGSQPWLPP